MSRTIYNMDLILSLELVRDGALRIVSGISLCAVYEYDLYVSNKEERDLGTANTPSTDDRSVRLLVSDPGFSMRALTYNRDI